MAAMPVFFIGQLMAGIVDVYGPKWVKAKSVSLFVSFVIYRNLFIILSMCYR